MSSSTVTAMAWNVEQGAWEPAARWLHEQAPDILFQQEVDPDKGLEQADYLGMDLHLAAASPPGVGRTRNAIFLRRGGPLVLAEEYEQGWAPWRAPANVTVRVRDADGRLSPREVSCVSGHGCYWSPDFRLTEARWCSTLAKPGWLALHFWDWNSYRTGEGVREWESYTDQAFVMNRTRVDAEGSRYADDEPDRAMLGMGYVELGRYAADHLGRPEAMKSASGYRTRPGRPKNNVRYGVDRGYLTPELAPAIRGFEICDTPALRGLSDHLPLRAVFDLPALRMILHKRLEPRRSPETGGTR